MDVLHEPGAVLGISPHPDDLVFSCGELLSACAGAVAVTVFAGVPDGRLALSDWDRRAGFQTSAQAMQQRREEDRAALRRLGARPLWLDFLDAQYAAAPAAAQIAAKLESLAEALQPQTLLIPLGLFHSDHRCVFEACRLLLGRLPARRWVAYEDALYRRIPGLLQQRLAALLDEGLRLTPLWVPLHGPGKAEAVACYASQLRAFGDGGYADTMAPEGYWLLEAP